MIDDMDGSINFKTKFYNLPGETLKERKKSFYNLLHVTPKSIPDEELDFEPRNYLESLYKVEALIYFRKTSQLLKVLKEGHVVFSCKIVKQRWFFEEAFCHIDEKKFVNEVLPSFSYAMRMKILKKVSTQVNEEKMDKLFDCIFNRYGLFVAAQFLSHCSRDKIEHILKNHIVKLLPVQLMRIFDKDPNLILLYWDEIKKNAIELPDDIKSFYVHVAQKDPEFLIQLQHQMNVRVKLGKRTTKGVIKKLEPEIKKDLLQYALWLKLSVLSRRMKEFRQLLNSSFPKWKSCTPGSDFRGYLETYPNNMRWKLFAQVYKEIHGHDILENIANLDRWVIQLALPHVPDIKERWAMLKYKETNDPEFLVWFPPSTGVPLLREKINLTSSKDERAEYLKYLLRSCTENKDLVALERTLSYICYRHRNEDIHVLTMVLQQIENSGLDLMQLNDNHWKSINELLDIHKARSAYFTFTNLKYKFIEYIYTCDKVDKYKFTVDYINGEVKNLLCELPTHPKRNAKVLHDIYIDFAKILETADDDDKYSTKLSLLEKIIDFNGESEYKVCAPELELFEDGVHNLSDVRYLNLMIKYNSTEPTVRFMLPEGEDFLKFLLDMLQSNHSDEALEQSAHKKYYVILDLLTKIVKKTKRSELENQILDTIFRYELNRSSHDTLLELMEYFLQNEPRKIISLFKLSPSSGFNFHSLECYTKWNLKKYGFLGLDQLVIESQKQILQQVDEHRKIEIFQCLSKLMTTEDFIKLIEPLIPKEFKLDTENEEQKQEYRLQCKIVEDLKHILEPSKINNIVMTFSQGDYLQSSLSSLYKVMYTVPEIVVFENVKVLSERAVSVRKHALYFASELLPAESVEELYLKTVITEGNSSNLKNWFTSALKYFVKNPSDHLLDMIISNLDKISENDKELLVFVTEEVQIPKKYQLVYIKKVWVALENLKEKQNTIQIEPYQDKMLEKMNFETLSNMNPNFIRSIIKKYFLNSDFDLMEIVLNYLNIYTSDEQFKFIFELLGNWKATYWGLWGNERNEIRKIFNFFGYVYSKLYEINNFRFTLLFKEHWEILFTHVESFTEYVALRFMVLYKEDQELLNFAKNFNAIVNELQQTYGYEILELIKDSFSQFSSVVKDFNRPLFLIHLLNVDKSEANISVAFWQLNRWRDEHSDNYRSIVNILENLNAPLIQIKLTALRKSGTLNF